MRVPTPNFPVVKELIEFEMADPVYSDTSADLTLKILGIVAEGEHPRMLELSGTISYTLESECSRCLKVTEKALETTFRSILDLAEGTTEAADLEAPAEPGCFELVSPDNVDVTEELRQRIYLATPPVVYCVDTCKGLCPKCGVNLNERRCRCSESRTGGPFEALRDFKVTDQKKE